MKCVYTCTITYLKNILLNFEIFFSAKHTVYIKRNKTNLICIAIVIIVLY